LFCDASAAGTLTESDPGKAAVVVVTPEDVWHTTTGSITVVIGPEVVVDVLDDGVDVVVEEPDPEALVLDDVVLCFGWLVELVVLGPDDPHAASTSASSPTTPTIPITLAQPAHPGNPACGDRGDTYASTVRSANTSANRRCASARRVGMCSVGTSCGVYPFRTRRATV
jgi:hypothetical protein